MLDFKISKLQVNNFRNLSREVVEFKPNINCIFGSNGNGKTNLLEALYYLIYRKSFRKNTQYSQILSLDAEESEISFLSLFEKENEKLTLSGKVNLFGSTWFKNNEIIKSRLKLNALFISPFDSYLFHTTASFRRNWFDHHIGLLDNEFKKNLKDYNLILKQRNSLLSEKPKDYGAILKALHPQLVNTSFILIQKRKKFIDEINEFTKIIFKKVFSLEHELLLEYESKFNYFSEEEINEYFLVKETRDINASITAYGVHRDDYLFKFDKMNSYEYCSLGQQKMSYLSLIFAYIELFRYKSMSTPIVLMDDVSGELDSRRLKNLIGYLELEKFQILITTANEGFKKELELIPAVQKIYLDNGKIFVATNE